MHWARAHCAGTPRTSNVKHVGCQTCRTETGYLAAAVAASFGALLEPYRVLTRHLQTWGQHTAEALRPAEPPAGMCGAIHRGVIEQHCHEPAGHDPPHFDRMYGPF